MPANTTPIFTNVPDIGWPSATNGTVTVSAVNTVTTAVAYDGTTNAVLVFTAGSNGSFVQKLVLEAGGSTGFASVLRVHINNGTANTNASANTLYMQYSLPSVTAATTTATAHIEVPLMLQLPATYRIYVSLGSTSNLTPAGWFVTAVAGDY
jgi:hypothetical protein